MKKSVMLLCAGLLVFAAPAAAAGDDLPSNVDWDLVVKNLVIGLQSDNLGLKKSCALMLGHIKAEDAVIPLMGVLHCCPDGGVRGAAAWALCQIDDSRGTYAVKQTAIYDSDNRTQAVCAWYYNLYVKDGTFIIRQPEAGQIAILLP